MQGDLLTLTGSDYNHIRNVLRMKEGDKVSVSCGDTGREYIYRIEDFGQEEVRLSLLEEREKNCELPVKVILFQGIPKSDKMELVIQKAVELGAAGVVPVEMERCVVRLDEGKKKKKTARWQTIAQSAAEQSERQIIPQVFEPMSMKAALSFAKEHTDCILLPYERKQEDGSTAQILSRLQPGQTVGIFIGPEGGFDPKEIEMAGAQDAQLISLGKRILRTETAGLTILSWMIYLFEIQ